MKEGVLDSFAAALKERLPGVQSTSFSSDAFAPVSVRSAQVAIALATELAADLRFDLSELNEWVSFDDRSLIAHVQGGITLGEVEARLGEFDATLDLSECDLDQSVSEWIANGMPGADDPVAQNVSGLDLLLRDGRLVVIRPAPRRAVGPDIVGAVIGGRGALGLVIGVHLVARKRKATERLAFDFPSVADAESARAWIRGKGVRPRKTWLIKSGQKQRLVLELRQTTIDLAAAQSSVVQAIATKHGGTPTQITDVPSQESNSAVNLSPTLTDLAAKLAAATSR